MDGARSDPPQTGKAEQAASGGPLGMRWFEAHAETLFENGYAPIPIKAGQKVPAIRRWTDIDITDEKVASWVRSFPDCGVGLRTGGLIGVDIDILDPDVAWEISDLATRTFGETLMRVGRWPKRLLLYRTDAPFTKIDVKPLEILGVGQQFVAFGLHPESERAYLWPLGETPLDVPLSDLPVVSEKHCMAFASEANARIPLHLRPGASGSRRGGGKGGSGIDRDETCKVVDGRDAWLSVIAFHAVHDALDRGDALDPEVLSERVWSRFTETTDLDRSKGDGRRPWGVRDARKKVADKLGLYRLGRLPARQKTDVEASYAAPTLTAAEARAMLEARLRAFLDEVRDWHAGGETEAAPRLAIQATTGLGKSATSRRLISEMRRDLKETGAAHRVLVFVPSHALAEEAAEEWRATGATVAVLRGYERVHPQLGQPMCQDIEAVKAAMAAGLEPNRTVCSHKGKFCAFYQSCLKQQNRRDVADADIVLAPYDALFTGFAVDPGSVGLIVVDESFWGRSWRTKSTITVEGLMVDMMGSLGTGMTRVRNASQMADRRANRQKLQAALAANGVGAVKPEALEGAGLTAQDCDDAARLERKLMVDPGLRPGLKGGARRTAFAQAKANERVRGILDLWWSAVRLLGDPDGPKGRIRIEAPDDKTGTHAICTIAAATIDRNFAGKPILHLDATMRPEIVDQVLPETDVASFEAAALHMAVHLVTGSFGKGSIVPTATCAPDERKRRQNNLDQIVTYIRWQARRLAPGRVLVVTYKAIEEVFAGIPGIETGHFNALAGLDCFGDVAAVFVVGRPLPSSEALPEIGAALFGELIEGEYRSVPKGVRMRDGSSRTVRVVEHSNEMGELIRAAICDDEVIQDVGRGRGINRTAEDPLEVHILADIALPLVHDSVTSWDVVQTNIVQSMLLEGVAVDSPADAVKLHPGLFANSEQAKKAFDRAGFKGQIPIRTFYRGMSLKCAAYKRGGRGCGWQNAYWIDDGLDARTVLEAAVGPVSDWILR